MPSKMYAIVIVHCALFICCETSNTSCHLNYKDTVNKESISMETEKFDAKNENGEINNFNYRDYDSRNRVSNLCYRIVPTSEDTSKNILSKPIPTFPRLNNTEINYFYESNEPIDLSTKSRTQIVSGLQNNLLCKNKGVEKQLYHESNISSSNKDNNTLKSLEKTKGTVSKHSKSCMLKKQAENCLNQNSGKIRKNISNKKKNFSSLKKLNQKSLKGNCLIDNKNKDNETSTLSSSCSNTFFDEEESNNFDERNIFCFLGEHRKYILELKLDIKNKYSSRYLKAIIRSLKTINETMHISLNTRYCRIIKHLESNCSIIFQALVQYSKKDKNFNKNNIAQREDILKFYNLIHNDLIFRNFHFENGKNFFSGIETTESFKLKDYGLYYKEYVKEFYDEFKQIFGIVSLKYLKSFLDKFMRLNAIDTPPRLTNLLRHSFLTEETQKAFIVLCKILQNTVKNKDFEIICLLIPEFEEAITLILKEKVTFINIKFTHYIIGIVITKLNFLKHNICYELKKYKDNHTASYLESPMLKTFITSVQTLLLIVLSEKVCKIEESLLFKVLVLKNFLNYVSVRNIYRREYRNFFLLNFIPKCNFTSVNFGKLKFRQACTNIYWNSSFDTLNLEVLSDKNYFTENLMKFLNLPYSTLNQPVFEGAVETIDKIRNFFVKIYYN